MKFAKLGLLGPEVSTVGFGAWAIGGLNWGKTEDAVSKRALHAALDAGVTLIDTADVYGFGHSETLIGEVLKERGKGKVIVASKAGNDFYHSSKEDDSGYGPIRQNTDKDYIIWAAEQSLKRLQVEALDLLQIHSSNTDLMDRDDPWEALTLLKEQGKILYAGWSVQSFNETEQAYLLDKYYKQVDVIQVRYNLLERDAEKDLFPRAEKYGIGVIVRIPLLFGFLTGKFTRQTTFSEDDHRRFNLSAEKLMDYSQKLEKMQPLFDRFPEQTKTQLSLRFCLSHPACSTVIPGVKTPEQVTENCSASDLGAIPLNLIPSLE